MKRIVAGLFGAVLVVTACSSESKALSKEEFLKQGNAICKTGNDLIDAAFRAAFPNQTEEPDPAAVKKLFTDTVLPNVKKQIDDVDKLKPPKELESQVDTLVSQARSALTKLQAAVEKDPNAAFAGEDPFAEANKTAAAIGLTSCADSEGDSGSGSSSN